MSLFARSAPGSTKRSVSFQDVFGKGLEWDRGGVTYTSVTGLDAVAASVGLLTDVVTMLPVDVFEDKAGVADPVVTAPALVRDPSDIVDALVWRSQALVSCLLWGNAWGFVLERDRFGFPTMVDWLDPGLVEVEEKPLRRPEITYAGQQLGPEQVLHLTGRYVRPGSAVGIAPLERFKETFGLAIAARKFGSDWFRNGAIPSAVVTSKSAVNQESAALVKDRIKKATKDREPLVLGDDVTYSQVQVAANESQFNETSDRQVVAVARVFGLPPEMIAAAMSGSSVTYANREQRAIDFLTFAADPWLVRFEHMWTRNLPDPQYARFNRGALLRTDLNIRYAVHDKAIRAGFATVNERRALEDLPPVDGGDERLWPPYRAFPVPSDQETE